MTQAPPPPPFDALAAMRLGASPADMMTLRRQSEEQRQRDDVDAGMLEALAAREAAHAAAVAAEAAPAPVVDAYTLAREGLSPAQIEERLRGR